MEWINDAVAALLLAAGAALGLKAKERKVDRTGCGMGFTRDGSASASFQHLGGDGSSWRPFFCPSCTCCWAAERPDTLRPHASSMKTFHGLASYSKEKALDDRES